MKSSVMFVGISQRILAVTALLSLLFSPFANLVSVVAAADETIDYCHAPSGDLDKAQKHLDEPESAWNGHKGHDGDFIILTQDDENLCDAIVLLRQCADREDNDSDSLIDEEDPGCWTDPEDPGSYDPFDDDETHVVIPEDDVDLSVTKEADVTAPGEGDTVTYSITVTNNGTTDATNVVVTDTLPPGTTFVSATPTETGENPYTWEFATIAAGESEEITLAVTIDEGTGGQTITNNVSVTGDEEENNEDNNATTEDVVVEEPILLCQDPNANNQGQPLPCSYDSEICEDVNANNTGGALPCTYDPISVPGCTDPLADNFDPEATEDTEPTSCEYTPDPIVGCMDPEANNYDESATEDTEPTSCLYDPEVIVGCMDPEATNFDETATEDTEPTSCVYPEPEPVFGCMDDAATNYDPSATEDDGSCVYPEPEVCEDETALNYGAEEECMYPEIETCEDDSAVNFGEEGECEYQNSSGDEDEEGIIVIQKVYTVGSDLSQTFTFDVSWSDTDIILGGNVTEASATLDANETYSIEEIPLPPGWNLDLVQCASSDSERDMISDSSVPFMLKDGETITCTYTNDQDRYIIFGNIWEDADADGEVDEGEAGLSGRTVRATNQNDENEVIVSQSDANGNWELNVPQGTWLVTQDVPSGWEHTGEQSYLVTVPGPEHETFVEEEDESLIARIMNFFVPTAYAAIIQPSVGPLNFGNKLIPVNTGGGGGGGGGGSSSSGSKKVTQQAPVGEVLGAATSVIPQGAPNTGGGGTSPLAVDLPILRAIIAAAGSVVRKTKKNARIS